MRVRNGRSDLGDLLGPANKSKDKKNGKKGSENAAADVHGNLL